MAICRRCLYLDALGEAWTRLQRACRRQNYRYDSPEVVEQANDYMNMLESALSEEPDLMEYLPAA